MLQYVNYVSYFQYQHTASVISSDGLHKGLWRQVKEEDNEVE